MIASLESWWTALSQPEQIFWAMAIVSSVFFFIQFVMAFVGIDHDVDSHVDMDVGDGGFALISIRSLAAFFMFFGWGGVAALYQGLALSKAIMVAFLFGFLAMVGVAYLLAMILKLQESGTVHIASAKNQIGDVYVPIPALGEGKGRIQISLKGKVMEFDAQTNDEALETGTKVAVVEVLEDNVLVVEKAI